MEVARARHQSSFGRFEWARAGSFDLWLVVFDGWFDGGAAAMVSSGLSFMDGTCDFGDDGVMVAVSCCHG
jgi:hypothetical protein